VENSIARPGGGTEEAAAVSLEAMQQTEDQVKKTLGPVRSALDPMRS
jgi:hypothetical protein